MGQELRATFVVVFMCCLPGNSLRWTKEKVLWWFMYFQRFEVFDLSDEPAPFYKSLVSFPSITSMQSLGPTLHFCRHFLKPRQFSSSSTIHDFLQPPMVPECVDFKQAIESTQAMFDVLAPHLTNNQSDTSPFFNTTNPPISTKLSHWEAINTDTSTSTTATVQPTLNVRGLHVWSKRPNCNSESLALAFSNCLAEHLPTDKVHRTTMVDFLGFVRQQLFSWQKLRREDVMFPDVSAINIDCGDSDPIVGVVDAISDHCWVLQLDDWNVHSLSDAMLIRRVFTRMYNNGTFVVSSGMVPVEHYGGTPVQQEKYASTRDLLRKRVYSVAI